MKALIFIILLLAGNVSLSAQTLVMKDGRRVPFTSFSVSGGMLRVPTTLPEGGKMEVSYPLDTLASIEAEEPAEIGEARKMLTRNKPNDAIALLKAPLLLYGSVKTTPGQWWSQAAILQASALEMITDPKSAQALYREIVVNGAQDPAAANLASVRLLSLSENLRGEALRAELQKTKELIQNPDQRIQGELQLLTARLLMQEERFREAAEAYLSVKVFFPSQPSLQPAATLGAARAFYQMDDLTWAKFYLEDLKNRYPTSSEFAAAREDTARLERRQKTNDLPLKK